MMISDQSHLIDRRHQRQFFEINAGQRSLVPDTVLDFARFLFVSSLYLCPETEKKLWAQRDDTARTTEMTVKVKRVGNRPCSFLATTEQTENAIETTTTTANVHH
jgi:hypothetical protein